MCENKPKECVQHDYRLDFATRSSSSFFLIAYEFDDPWNYKNGNVQKYIVILKYYFNSI